MGTVVSIDVRDMAARGVDAVDRAVDWLQAVDDAYSTYRPSSAVRRIDRGELAIADASHDVRWILRRCEELRRETAGYFDARATGSLDPSALVKGWSVERAARILTEAGLQHFCITCGGDVTCRGGALPAEHWSVGVQHPLDRGALAAAVSVRDAAVATSGTYERGEHIRDPHASSVPTGVLSVTVIGPDLGTADAYSTAAFAMGSSGSRWLASRTPLGYESLTILANGRMLRTPGFPLTGATA